IKIKSPNKCIWENTYHVVIEFRTTFIDKKNKKRIIPIYCSAHSDEPRRNVYKSLKYLWDNGFALGDVTIPKPLFYSDYFKGTFYKGVEGLNLYYYIRHKKFDKIEEIIPHVARWFAKLHQTKICGDCNFNKENSRIKTVIPGRDEIIRKVGNWYPEYKEFYEEAYSFFIKNEENFLNSNKEKCLVHGDAHPENIIRINKNKIAVIDFTDLCLADFARDLGCFLQQLNYMTSRKIRDDEYSEKMRSLFLDNYLKYSKKELNENLKSRIDNYYYWTAIRTATFFLIKDDAEPERAISLIKEVKDYLAKK
ncbi:aminoglycoside phosphotransferase family protein, partial [bacterium]|nr:aminoglycoside phosphotransferase family protein [bacterium]